MNGRLVNFAAAAAVVLESSLLVLSPVNADTRSEFERSQQARLEAYERDVAIGQHLIKKNFRLSSRYDEKVSFLTDSGFKWSVGLFLNQSYVTYGARYDGPLTIPRTLHGDSAEGYYKPFCVLHQDVGDLDGLHFILNIKTEMSGFSGYRQVTIDDELPSDLRILDDLLWYIGAAYEKMVKFNRKATRTGEEPYGRWLAFDNTPGHVFLKDRAAFYERAEEITGRIKELLNISDFSSKPKQSFDHESLPSLVCG